MSVFPAYAGVSPSGVLVLLASLGLPRLRGGEPSAVSTVTVMGPSSPPTRG